MDQENADAEVARARQARFGTLPARVRPDDAVETVETGSPQSRPGASGTEDQRQAFLAGG